MILTLQPKLPKTIRTHNIYTTHSISNTLSTFSIQQLAQLEELRRRRDTQHDSAKCPNQQPEEDNPIRTYFQNPKTQSGQTCCLPTNQHY